MSLAERLTREHILARLSPALCCCALLLTAACGGPAPAPTPPPQPAAAPAPAAAPPVSAPAPLPEDPKHRLLVGTEWRLGEMTVHFLDAGRLLVKGGDVAPHAPGGITVKYRYTDGAVEASVMGQPIAAQWDGASLSVGGLAAEKMAPDSTDNTR